MLRFSAVLTFGRRERDVLSLGITCLFPFPSDEAADIFAIIDVIPCINLFLDPVILPVGKGDGFAYSPHASSKVRYIIFITG